MENKRNWALINLMLIITLALMLAPSAEALAVSGQITGDSVNVRSGPGTSNSVIGSLNTGDSVTVISSSNGWYNIKSGSLNGWVSGDFCQVVQCSLTVTEAQVNVRTGPGIEYDSYGQIGQGTVVTLLDVAGDWYKIQAASGTIGYIRSDLVSEGTASTPNTNTATPAVNQPVTTPSSTPPVVPRVVLDGRQLSFSVDPAFENGRLLVPLRTIFEAMGATVTWNPDTQTAGAVREGVTVIMPLNSTTPSVNGQAWTLDVPAKVVNNVTLAPVRFVAEAFGGKVMWDSSTYIAYITSSDGNAVVNSPDSSDNPSSSDSSSNDSSNDSSNNNDSSSDVIPVDADGLVTVSLDATASGAVVTMTGDGYMKVVIKENSGEILYLIKNKALERAFSLSQPLGDGIISVTGINTSEGASIDISFPAGLAYSPETEADGAIEMVNFTL